MFRLNRLTDYAVVVMAQMSQHGTPVRTAAQSSEETGVPLPTVAKLLGALSREGLVHSQRGVAGGYQLEKAASDITMADIIQALDGPIALTACVDGNSGACDVEQLCPMRGNWDKVNQAIRNALSQVTLEDMSQSLFSFEPNPLISQDVKEAR